jgi:hypothetical protein
VLALVSPVTFGRANRIKARACALATALGITELWQIEIAAMLCQLGFVGIPDEVLARVQRGAVLGDEEQRMIARVPEITESLLGNIPRIDTVREIVALHVKPPAISSERRLAEVGAHILRVALEVDAHEHQFGAVPMIDFLRTRGCDRQVVEAHERLACVPVATDKRDVAIAGLRAGMVFAEDVLMVSGALLVARGYEVTPGFLERVRNFPPGTVRTPMKIVD